MTATLIASRVDPIDAGFMPGFMPEFMPELEVRLAGSRPSHAVFVRRRLLVALVLVALCVAVGVTARSVLADRGGVPASTPAIQPETVPTGVPTYVVQPGDTLWSIAGRLRGKSSMSDYVDRLVSGNGGAAVQAGQLLILP